MLVSLGPYRSFQTRKTIQNTPFQQHAIFSNTEMLWVGFFFCIFFLNNTFFSLKNSLFCVLNILSRNTASTEMWYPKIWIRCWYWWLLNGHLLYGSTPFQSQNYRIPIELVITKFLNFEKEDAWTFSTLITKKNTYIPQIFLFICRTSWNFILIINLYFFNKLPIAKEY